MFDLIVVAIVAFGLGLCSGLWFAGRQFGRQLKADMQAGRLSKDEAIRIADLRDAR